MVDGTFLPRVPLDTAGCGAAGGGSEPVDHTDRPPHRLGNGGGTA